MAKHQVSDETKAKVEEFEQADKLYKLAWENFEHKHSKDLDELDKLRETRNEKLDNAVRTLRAEGVEVDIMQTKRIDCGPLYVQKKWSEFYAPAKFVAMLKEHGLYDAAISAKIVVERTDVADYTTVKAFLEKEGKTKDFEECEDGKELTPAVYGPKPIPPIGAEAKERKT